MKKYTVILLYPMDDSDISNSESYLGYTTAENPQAAEWIIRQQASSSNDEVFPPEDFALIAVFEGHLTPV